MATKGLFISFEGGEGAGKSTQVGLLLARLRAHGHEAISVREPGGTPLGEQVRSWVKSVDVAPATELLLFASARAQLVEKVIKPSLERGRIVVADRFADSTVAYQGYGRGLPLDLVESVNKVATGGLMPDITFLLDLPVEAAMERIGRPQLGLESQGKATAGRADEAGQSKFEEAGSAFHRRVRSGFLKLVKAEPRRILLMDAANPGDEIAAAVWQAVEPALKSRQAAEAESKAKPGQSRLI